jgi:FdhD protein
MEDMYRQVKIIKVANEGIEEDDLVALDALMILEINGIKIGEFYLSPHDLEDFVYGYLLDERYIHSFNEVENIKVDDSVIKVNLKSKNLKKKDISSYDGWIHENQPIPIIESNYKVKKKIIFNSFELLIKKANIWAKTGGTHVAALIDKDHFILREDVSRHVAVDKVIGAGLKADLNFSKTFIACSGRIPPDRVMKLANVGIPIMITKAAPTIEGLKIGEKSGITLIGFLREGRFNIYTHPHRIII